MEQREKLLLRVLCGVFALVALVSVLLCVTQVQRAEKQETLLRISSEDLLYESIAEAETALIEAAGEEEMTQELSLRFLRAAVGGQMSLALLSNGEEGASGLMRFFLDLETVAAGEERAGMQEYAEALSEHLSSARAQGESLWENMPLYTEDEQQSVSSGQIMQALTEKEARAMAAKALGGNLKLEPAAVQDDSGYAYLLKNAYVRIGVSGRVTGMLRELSYPDGTEAVLSQEDAEACAAEVLIGAGYDQRSVSVEGSALAGLIWQVDVQYGEASLLVGISAVSGAWCELRENGEAEN